MSPDSALGAPDQVGGGWVTFFLNNDRRSWRSVKSNMPPVAADAENWPRPKKYAGELVAVKVLRSVAGLSYAVTPGITRVPAELARELVKGQHARFLRPGEQVPDDE